MKMLSVVFFTWISLFDQCPSISAVPDPFPTLVCPGQTEGEVWFSTGKNFIKWSFEELFSCKPVVPVAETLNPSFPCKLSLLLAHFRHAQIIKTQVGRQVGLVVTFEKRLGFSHIGPFGKSFPPPLVIFRDGVVLRKIKCDQSGFFVHDLLFLNVAKGNSYYWLSLFCNRKGKKGTQYFLLNNNSGKSMSNRNNLTLRSTSNFLPLHSESLPKP